MQPTDPQPLPSDDQPTVPTVRDELPWPCVVNIRGGDREPLVLERRRLPGMAAAGRPSITGSGFWIGCSRLSGCTVPLSPRQVERSMATRTERVLYGPSDKIFCMLHSLADTLAQRQVACKSRGKRATRAVQRRPVQTY